MLQKIIQVDQEYNKVSTDGATDPLWSDALQVDSKVAEQQPELDHAQVLPPDQQVVVWRCFFLLWLGGTWPYQSILQVPDSLSATRFGQSALLQAQAYYVKAFDAPYLEFYILMTFTWGLLVCHLFQVLTGSAKVL